MIIYQTLQNELDKFKLSMIYLDPKYPANKNHIKSSRYLKSDVISYLKSVQTSECTPYQLYIVRSQIF